MSPSFISLSRAVCANEYKGWKFEDHAATFTVEGKGIKSGLRELFEIGVATYLLIVGKVSKAGSGVWGREDTSDAFLSSNWSASGVAGVYNNSRISCQGQHVLEDSMYLVSPFLCFGRLQ